MSQFLTLNAFYSKRNTVIWHNNIPSYQFYDVNSRYQTIEYQFNIYMLPMICKMGMYVHGLEQICFRTFDEIYRTANNPLERKMNPFMYHVLFLYFLQYQSKHHAHTTGVYAHYYADRVVSTFSLKDCTDDERAFVCVMMHGVRDQTAWIYLSMAQGVIEIQDANISLAVKVFPSLKQRSVLNTYDDDSVAHIGSGTYGTVYVVKRKGMNKALKFVSERFQPNSTWNMFNFFETVVNERNIGVFMNHERILKYDAVFEIHPYCYAFEMEYTEFGSLNQIKRPSNIKSLIRAQIFPAVAFLHENGMIHGDVKIENVLVMQDGTLKLSDFGMADYMNYQREGFTYDLNQRYQSPVISKRHVVSAQLDAWNLFYLYMTCTSAFDDDWKSASKRFMDAFLNYVREIQNKSIASTDDLRDAITTHCNDEVDMLMNLLHSKDYVKSVRDMIITNTERVDQPQKRKNSPLLNTSLNAVVWVYMQDFARLTRVNDYQGMQHGCFNMEYDSEYPFVF